MKFDLDGKIIVESMIHGFNSTTVPTFGTTATSASRAIECQGEELTVLLIMGPQAVTTSTTTFTLKLQESDTNSATEGDWTDIPNDASTTSCRFFETPIVSTTPGENSFNGNIGYQQYYGTLNTNPRKKWIRAVPTITSAANNAFPCTVLAIHTELRNSDLSDTSQFRVSQSDDGVNV